MREDDDCWYCQEKGERKMTRSNVLLHCTNERLVAARLTPLDEVRPGGVQILFASLRWGRRQLHFLSLCGVGRGIEDGEDEEDDRAARRMDG
jgi:hypothetical protein